MLALRSDVGEGQHILVYRVPGDRRSKCRRVPKPDLRGRRALIIDDNAQAREVLSSMLTSMTLV